MMAYLSQEALIHLRRWALELVTPQYRFIPRDADKLVAAASKIEAFLLRGLTAADDGQAFGVSAEQFVAAQPLTGTVVGLASSGGGHVVEQKPVGDGFGAVSDNRDGALASNIQTHEISVGGVTTPADDAGEGAVKAPSPYRISREEGWWF